MLLNRIKRLIHSLISFKFFVWLLVYVLIWRKYIDVNGTHFLIFTGALLFFREFTKLYRLYLSNGGKKNGKEK